MKKSPGIFRSWGKPDEGHPEGDPAMGSGEKMGLFLGICAIWGILQEENKRLSAEYEASGTGDLVTLFPLVALIVCYVVGIVLWCR